MHRKPKYGEARDAVLAAHNLGLSVREAAKQSGLSLQAIRSSSQHLGITLRGERRPHGSVKKLVLAGHAAGLSVPQLSETSGVPTHTLYATATRLSITLAAATRGPKNR